MKKILALVLLTVSLSATAHITGESDGPSISPADVRLSPIPRPITLFPRCTWTGATGECVLQNYTWEDVACNFQVNASTRMGYRYSNTQYRALYRGMSAWIRVYANNPQVDPIVNMYAVAYCRTMI